MVFANDRTQVIKLRNIGKTMRDSKTAKSVSYHPYLIESLKDPEEAAAY
jgi:hypothetical protein